ncbi:MAG: UDP-N-acetylmuramoyl-L-alanine--D-glutamate ligase [bacterium]|jgi:UDP-N-acetylmuramoylalanine--D-glutamate ligase
MLFPKTIEGLAGARVTIMGLGLHGGGLASAKFFAKAGARVTVTDLRDEKILAPSIQALDGHDVRFVLGKHKLEDFRSADLVIKNPAVRGPSPYLAAARHVETDISVFLRYSKSPLVAVTGSKGKSSTVSAIHHGFIASGIQSLLGGNITISPLEFLGETAPDRPVTLELSSWQLADMRGLGVLKPRAALITAIMPDHMNYYASMAEYVADKRLIYADQDSQCASFFDADSSWGLSFASETRAELFYYSAREPQRKGAWLEEKAAPGPGAALDPAGSSPGCLGPEGYCRIGDASDSLPELILPADLLVPGAHMRKNLLASALVLRYMGLSPEKIAAAMASFPGVEHRLEFFARARGVSWYNDSAATIPQAVEAALDSFSAPVVLITGGTDKNLEFEPTKKAYAKAKAIVLLEGTGTEKLMPLLAEQGISWKGPYGSLDAAVNAADRLARPGQAVLLSPGCASFGMFLHEFDRGKKFKEAVRARLGLS